MPEPLVQFLAIFFSLGLGNGIWGPDSWVPQISSSSSIFQSMNSSLFTHTVPDFFSSNSSYFKVHPCFISILTSLQKCRTDCVFEGIAGRFMAQRNLWLFFQTAFNTDFTVFPILPRVRVGQSSWRRRPATLPGSVRPSARPRLDVDGSPGETGTIPGVAGWSTP